MDWFSWIKFSLLIASVAGALAWGESMDRTIRSNGFVAESDAAKKHGLFIFKLFISVSLLTGVIGKLNELLGYPFT